jgi:hypothetical protein
VGQIQVLVRRETMNALRNGTIPISSRKMVRFTPNMPVEVALQCTDGVRIEGRYGDRVKYTLADERTMYVDPVVAERIRELDVQPGEVFQICKCQDKKTIFWWVRRDSGLDSQLERDLLASLERARNPKPTPLAAPTPDPSPTAKVTSAPPPNAFHELNIPPPSNGVPHNHHRQNGSGQTPASPAPPLAKDAPPPLPSTQLAHALKTAISAAADAEKFAKTLDYNIRFTTDDIRSMGITVLIGMQQRMPR